MVNKQSFPPVCDGNTRVLVLGSLPGDASLAQARYYAHPSNQFWPLIGAVIGQDLRPLGYDDRLDALRAAGVGLWDVLSAATRAGSSDSAIRGARTNDLRGLKAVLPSLRAIAFNGGKAAKTGAQLLADCGVPLLPVPSSSAAYCRISLDEKRARWMAIKPYLAPARVRLPGRDGAP